MVQHSGGCVNEGPKTPIPAELEALRGIAAWERSDRRFGLMLSHRVLPTPPSSVASISTYVPGMNHPLRNPASACATPASDSVALSTGCVRAHTWRRETSERRLPCFQVPGTPFQASPSAGFPTSAPGPCGPEAPFTSLASRPLLAKPTSYPGRGAFRCRSTGALGGAGHSRVRFFLRGLCCPLQAAFAPCDISLRAVPHCWRMNRYEIPRSLFRFDPPVECSFELPITYRLLLTGIRSRI